MNLITIKINGVEYVLKGTENEDYLHRVGRYVDKKMRMISEVNQRLSTTSVAVLTAVNIVDDLFKAHESNSNANQLTKEEFVTEQKYAEEIEELKGKLLHLEKLNSELQQRSIIDISEEELEILKDSAKKSGEAEAQLLSENKDLKMQLQNAKNKITYLQNKVYETQIDVANARNNNHNNNNRKY